MAWAPSRVSNAAKRSKRRRIHAMRLINQNRTGQPWVKPGNDGSASSGHMRRYPEPFPVLLRPAIGVAPVRLLSVRRGVTERRMDDGEVAHDAIFTSCACRFLIATGFAVCSRKAARSTSDLSGFEQ